MRDIALVAMIFGTIPIILRYPFAGILIWTWISIAVPHQETWGFSRSIPLNMIVAVATIGAWFFSRERKLPPPRAIYWIFIVFLLWMTFNSFFAVNPQWSWQYWDRSWKTILLGILAAGMATNKVRLHALMCVMVASLFYYGIKGGIFTLVTGGHYHVIGPPNSFIEDNNCLALALLIVLPLANYLRLQTRQKWLQIGIVIAMGFTTVSVVGSYSRGALVGLGAVAAAGIFRTRHRFVYLGVAAVLLVSIFQFMPESFHDRVQTMQDAGDDASFQSRLLSWQVAYYCARDHFPFGVGFYGEQLPEIYNSYFPTAPAHAAHSIYFQIMGDIGFIGLAIYLILIAAAFVTSQRIRNFTRDKPELDWIYQMVSMIQISMIGFCVGGAALSMAYYDVFILDIALLLPLSRIARLTVKAKQTAAFTPQHWAAPLPT